MAKIEKLDGGGTGAAKRYEGTITINSGGTGTSYSGGAGSGGGSNYTTTSGSGSNVGGTGGKGGLNQRVGTGVTAVAGGGIGNPTGNSYSDTTITNKNEINNGTGGLLVMYSNNIINNGEITSNGISSNLIKVKKRSSGDSWIGGYNAPGGASGGGSINIFYKDNCLCGTVKVNGGAGIRGHVASGAGGTGSISVGNILNGTYESTYANY